VDDITPLRGLTPEALAKEVVLIKARPSVQNIPAFGGWSNGDAQFIGPNPPEEAIITYYQRRRHIFGDFKIEILDEAGKSLGTIPTTKRRGLSRATWSMRLKPPQVPPAATGAGAASIGPRVLPGAYSVRLTRDDQGLTAPLPLVRDPRATYTAEDRRIQLDLAMKVYHLLADMTWAVERINAVRLAFDDRASRLPAEDALAKRLRTASAQVDEFRKKIVATKEGGMITGEERLREFLAELYGTILSYEGRPSQMQAQRADALARELADVVKGFDAWTEKELAGVNATLADGKLDPVKPLTREEWEKRRNTP
jgi:hypothetical protein